MKFRTASVPVDAGCYSLYYYPVSVVTHIFTSACSGCYAMMWMRVLVALQGGEHTHGATCISDQGLCGIGTWMLSLRGQRLQGPTVFKILCLMSGSKHDTSLHLLLQRSRARHGGAHL